jgi:hypothetical protein
MKRWLKPATLALLLLPQLCHALELTGRFSMLGATATAQEGDLGYSGSNADTLTADQQSVRLMLDEVLGEGEWSLHLRTLRQHLSGYPMIEHQSTELFRYRQGSGDWLDEQGNEDSTWLQYELDRLLYRHRFERVTLSLGRQAVDWGSGRLWQPLNIFGAFAPTALDSDFKPGIDALILEAYPSAFSTMTAAYVLAPYEDSAIKDSGALHYRRQVGGLSELSLLAGSIIGNRVAGAAFESAIGGMGWRVEGLQVKLEEGDESALFWIAGLDYQFTDGTLIAAEWHDNSRGASREDELADAAKDPLVIYGLQQHLSRQVLGLVLERDLTPLLRGGYTLLAAPLLDENGERHVSVLHQLNLSYSVSNESDLMLSLLTANGLGMNDAEEPRSEFGHTPTTATLRLRFYF